MVQIQDEKRKSLRGGLKKKMKNFEYKVSVIVPVYNVSEYLEKCLDSLLAQTMDKNQMEILLINDGSTDNSFEICRDYASYNSVFKLFTKENEGLSATRNFGIDRAKGKYLMYLDSDDTFAPETVKAVTDFFDKHYDEVDLVTYLDQPYKSGQKLKVHYRYGYMKKSGIYDLNKLPYISQTRVNICVKNMDENFYFDTTPGFRLEDQEYCSKVLMAKQKIGFCDKGEYRYNRSNGGSIVSNYFYAYYIFESSMDYFERLFAQFEGEVPRYYQSMFMNDLQWKHNENKLYPYHYNKEDFDHAMDRIKALLAKVEPDIIYNHPQLDNFNKQYWLNMKPNVYPAVIADDELCIYVDGKRIYHWNMTELIMHKLRVNGDDLRFMGFIKTPIYAYRNEPMDIYAVENEDFEHKKKIPVYESIYSYYHSLTKTCNFWGFSYHCDINKVHSLRFVVDYDGIFYNTRFFCMPVAVFTDKISSYIRGNARLTRDGNTLRIEKVSPEQAEVFEDNQNQAFKNSSSICGIRKKSLAYRKEHRVWLYYDLHTVEKDNGYYQFMNDIKHDDGIERYYVYDRELSEIEHLFTDELKSRLVRFGSRQHKLLYLSAEKILTAFYGFSTISPFKTETEEANYLDIFKAEIYYLQHGVLHANLRTKNHAERCRADKYVVSTPFEKKTLMEHYAYEEDDIVCTGMARYDYMDRSRKPLNRIIFAPSWREYLTVVLSGSNWELQKNKVANSDYYIKFMEFLTGEKLARLLEENDLYLDLKLHPIIKDSKDLFETDNPRICFAPDSVDLEDYKVFITDISSYVYDFVYLKRPVIYFMPDMDQFKSGMNHYRELELPFEEGFGNLALEADEAADELEKIILNNFEPEKKFKDKMASFFFESSHHAEDLYDYIMKK